MTRRFRLPVYQAMDGEVPIPGATLTFKVDSDIAVIYAEPELETPLPNPIAGDAGGSFLPIFLDSETTYDVELHDGESLVDSFEITGQSYFFDPDGLDIARHPDGERIPGAQLRFLLSGTTQNRDLANPETSVVEADGEGEFSEMQSQNDGYRVQLHEGENSLVSTPDSPMIWDVDLGLSLAGLEIPAHEQIAGMAESLGAIIVYDPDNPDTWELDEEGRYISIADTFGNAESIVAPGNLPAQFTEPGGRRLVQILESDGQQWLETPTHEALVDLPCTIVWVFQMVEFNGNPDRSMIKEKDDARIGVKEAGAGRSLGNMSLRGHQAGLTLPEDLFEGRLSWFHGVWADADLGPGALFRGKAQMVATDNGPEAGNMPNQWLGFSMRQELPGFPQLWGYWGPVIIFPGRRTFAELAPLHELIEEFYQIGESVNP